MRILRSYVKAGNVIKPLAMGRHPLFEEREADLCLEAETEARRARMHALLGNSALGPHPEFDLEHRDGIVVAVSVR